MNLQRLSLLRKSSFFLPMQWMNGSQRHAMKALYGFCRRIDDIADGQETAASKHAALDDVAKQIGAIFEREPYDDAYKMLAQAVAQYGMQRDYFDEMIAGMRMDVDGPICKPSARDLQLYCYRVAGCVGLLVLPILGHETEISKRFAIALGHALQLTNIIRDVKVDADMGRIYLAHEWLQEMGCTDVSVEEIAADPTLMQSVCELAQHKALSYYEQTDQLLDNARALRPALMMRETYKRLLNQMNKDGFAYEAPYQLSTLSRMMGCVSALFILGGSKR